MCVDVPYCSNTLVLTVFGKAFQWVPVLPGRVTPHERVNISSVEWFFFRRPRITCSPAARARARQEVGTSGNEEVSSMSDEQLDRPAPGAEGERRGVQAVRVAQFVVSTVDLVAQLGHNEALAWLARACAVTLNGMMAYLHRKRGSRRS